MVEVLHEGSNSVISRSELQHTLILDPYYGPETGATDSITAAIYAANAEFPAFHQFKYQFSLLPCKEDAHLQLVLLWCSLMGLPAYRNGISTDWRWKDFLKNWTEEFELNPSELKSFLRENGWPLPVELFRDQMDNTARKVTLDADEYAATSRAHVITLPRLHKELADLHGIQPESMSARREKSQAIREIEHQIDSILHSDRPLRDETPAQRKTRLQIWFNQEVRARGERGALTRTATREGITRQSLRSILDR